MKRERKVLCQICKKEKKIAQALPAEFIRDTIADTIRKTHGDWSPAGYVCLHDLNAFRLRHIHEVLENERGALSPLEHEVIQSLQDQEVLALNPVEEFEKRPATLGERWADRIAEFGGSWAFIIVFLVVMCFWIGLNTQGLMRKSFDPYPYILLNLVLSCIAALQAPVIMMSQNRKEQRDRIRAEHEYQINLKAELEIRDLHQKLDQLRTHQWHRLMELYQSQTELIEAFLLQNQHVTESRTPVGFSD